MIYTPRFRKELEGYRKKLREIEKGEFQVSEIVEIMENYGGHRYAHRIMRNLLERAFWRGINRLYRNLREYLGSWVDSPEHYETGKVYIAELENAYRIASHLDLGFISRDIERKIGEIKGRMGSSATSYRRG